MMPLGVLIALDDFFFGHLFEAVLSLDAFKVVDGLAARLMDHTKCNGALGRGGRKHPDGNENEREAKIARPNWNGGHGDYSETLLTLANLGCQWPAQVNKGGTARKPPRGPTH